MSQENSHKKWQQANADKVRAYTAKYQANKVKASVLLDKWVADEINKVKPPEQPLGGWIKERLQKWAEASRTKTSCNPNDIF